MLKHPGDGNRAADVALLVLSCDRYSDLWQPYFKLFFRFWPDVPFPVYLGANEKKFDDGRVTTILSGADTDWSSSLRRIVEQIPEKHVFLLIEDAFFDKPVTKTQALRDLALWAVDEGISYIRFRPSPPPDIPVDERIGRIGVGALYRSSLFTSMWRKDALLACLTDGESAWAFELNGHKKTAAFEDFYSTREHYFSYIHGVEKGLWHRAAVRQMKRLGCPADLAARPQMSFRTTALWHLLQVKGKLLRLLPARLQPKALVLANRVYRLIGLRR